MLDYEIKKKKREKHRGFYGFMLTENTDFFKEPFPFKEELENYSGVSFDDFWDKYDKEKW